MWPFFRVISKTLFFHRHVLCTWMVKRARVRCWLAQGVAPCTNVFFLPPMIASGLGRQIVISKAVGSKAALYEEATPSTDTHRGAGNETFEVRASAIYKSGPATNDAVPKLWRFDIVVGGYHRSGVRDRTKTCSCAEG